MATSSFNDASVSLRAAILHLQAQYACGSLAGYTAALFADVHRPTRYSKVRLNALRKCPTRRLTPYRLLGTASSLLTTLNNPLNVTLLTSQLLSAPAIWTQPEGLRTCMRCMSVFHGAAQALVRHDLASHDKSPDQDFIRLQLERTLPKHDWIRAIANGADEHSPRWRHVLVLGGLLLGFGPSEEENLSRHMRTTLEEGLVSAINQALPELTEEDHFGQETITLVLNHCFPIISDTERSQLDYDRLLPVLMHSTFRTSEGLGSAYFLGAIDIDVRPRPGNKLSWPERTASYQQVRGTLGSPLVSSLGPLSRLIGHAVEQAREPWLVTGAVDDLEDFTKTLHLQWRQNRLAQVDAANEDDCFDEETKHSTTPTLWRLLRTTMYASIIILRSAIGRLLADSGLADDRTASRLAAQALQILRSLYFISNRTGSATFSQYTFVYLTTMDVMSRYPVQLESFLCSIKPSELDRIPQHPLDRNLDLFFLNTVEHFPLVLSAPVIEDLLVQSALPYLATGGDNNLLPIFEAAHSVMLAVFSAPQSSNFAITHLPFYIDALFKVFPKNLSARQFRLAFKTLMQITSPPSPLAMSQPLLPATLLELLHDRAIHSSTTALPPQPAAGPSAEDDMPLSEQTVLVLTVVDTLTQLPLDLLDEWLTIAAELVNAVDDEEMREHCKEHFWLMLVDGHMDPDRSRVCHAWWSSAGGREHVLYGRESAGLPPSMMSGALPVLEGDTKL